VGLWRGSSLGRGLSFSPFASGGARGEGRGLICPGELCFWLFLRLLFMYELFTMLRAVVTMSERGEASAHALVAGGGAGRGRCSMVMATAYQRARLSSRARWCGRVLDAAGGAGGGSRRGGIAAASGARARAGPRGGHGRRVPRSPHRPPS
jgi:hypothetical protein